MKILTGLKEQLLPDSYTTGANTRCVLAIGYIVGIAIIEIIGGPLYFAIGGEKGITYYVAMILMPFIAAYGAIYMDFYDRRSVINKKIRYNLPGLENSYVSALQYIQVPVYKDKKGAVKPVTYSKGWLLTLPMRFLTGLVTLLPELLIVGAVILIGQVSMQNVQVLQVTQPQNMGELFSITLPEFFPVIGKLFSLTIETVPGALLSLISPESLFYIGFATISFTLGALTNMFFWKKLNFKGGSSSGKILMAIVLLIFYYYYLRDILAGSFPIQKLLSELFS